MADRIQATPQSPGLGALARALRGAQQFAERPFGYPNPPVAMLSELLGLPAVQRTVERMSYGEPLTTGRGMTLRPREDTTEAALAVLPMAPGVVRGGLGAVKRATDLNAIRDYVRAAQGVGGMPGAAVVKPKGGNWISGAGSPEEAVRGLKRPEEPVAIPMDDAEMAAYRAQGYTRYDPETGALSRPDPLNQWIDQKLAKYIRNEMGTPEDPLRALVLERGVSHVPLETLEEGAGWIPDEVALARKRAGFPETGMVEEGSGVLYGDLSDLQRAASGWETAADVSIRGERAGDLMRLGEGSPTVRANPWLAKVPPETPVYSVEDVSGMRPRVSDLGFSHLVDELRNATRAGSDLPRELQLRPEQLSRVSMPQAVELVDRINKWRAAQKAEADLARSTNVATQTFKEYPEQGYKWVELKAPEDVKVDRKAILGDEADNPYGPPEESLASEVRYRALQDALKYEGETMGHCVGGYCPDVIEGRSRIFSLRDAKGQPHVTVEVRPGKQLSERDLPDDVRDMLAEQYGDESREVFEAAVQRYLKERAVPDEIVQIKGKANRAPKDEYLPYVQDFVKSQQWGRVGDLGNTGLVDISTYPDAPEYLRRGPRFISQQEYDDAVRRAIEEQRRTGNEPGFARGGMVSAGPAQYDPARISALADQLLMEA